MTNKGSLSDKQIAEDVLERMPEDASLNEIVQELEFIAAVRQGLSDLNKGNSISIDEVEQELPSWIAHT